MTEDMKQEIFNFFSKCNFDDILTEDNFNYHILDYLPQTLFGETYDWAWGVSKFVVIPKNKHFVIKIPFSGRYDEEDIYQDFLNANEDNSKSWDYCATEMFLYQKAKKYKVTEFFGKTKYIGNIENYPIYIQEKIIPISKCGSGASHQEKEKTKSHLTEKKYWMFNISWLADAYKYYGEKKCDRFMQFIKDYAYYLDDLHSDNIGYQRGKPMILDYAGFRD